MDADKLARMANQIALNLGPSKVQAVAGTADHMLRFWTPTMRSELAESHAHGTADLTEVAALALETAMLPGAAPQMRGTGGDAG